MHVDANRNKTYTGVGSRETPYQYLVLMRKIARFLARRQYELRSGSADGADTAFETGALIERGPCSAYLPWEGFNNKREDQNHKIIRDPMLLEKADKILMTIHPRYDKLKDGAKKLHTRNIFQVLGDDLNSPSDFLICYAEPTDTGVKGGTNTAWVLAAKHGIPCYNLWNAIDRYNLLLELEKIK